MWEANKEISDKLAKLALKGKIPEEIAELLIAMAIKIEQLEKEKSKEQ